MKVDHNHSGIGIEVHGKLSTIHYAISYCFRIPVSNLIWKTMSTRKVDIRGDVNVAVWKVVYRKGGYSE